MKRRKGFFSICLVLFFIWLILINLNKEKPSRYELTLSSIIYFVCCLPLLIYFGRSEKNIPMARVINSSKIIFNVIRHHNGNGHSMKTFEIPACAGFMLSNRTEEQLDFFPEDECAVYFSIKAELIDKIEYYLNNDLARMKIARAGYKKARQHTYNDRAKKNTKYL